jgi:hypothetical protein
MTEQETPSGVTGGGFVERSAQRLGLAAEGKLAEEGADDGS